MYFGCIGKKQTSVLTFWTKLSAVSIGGDKVLLIPLLLPLCKSIVDTNNDCESVADTVFIPPSIPILTSLVSSIV